MLKISMHTSPRTLTNFSMTTFKSLRERKGGSENAHGHTIMIVIYGV